ncbi:MAG: exodeoxyribonuclease VII small subunit [Thermoanaerobaculia bacterium]|nr:exodeoxyribonuclease VII small subunit [Thermoanaerobaculia bacterium]
MSAENRADEELSFSAAMDELERILKGIEDERVDIDVLGRELGRAAELLELCRGKIRRAEVEVTQIVQNLEQATSANDDDGGATEEDGGEERDDSGDDDDDGEGELPF